MMIGVLYISYDGMLEPLGQSQVLAYLKPFRDGRSDVKQTTTGFRDPRYHICQNQIPIPKLEIV